MISQFSRRSIDFFQRLQQSHIRNVVKYLKPGKPLIYITCSAFKAENEDVVDFIVKELGLKVEEQIVLKGYGHKADTMFAARLLNFNSFTSTKNLHLIFMFETVSVDDALARGKRTVTMPAILVLVVTLGLSMFAAIALNIPDLTGWLIGGGFILSFVLSWLWWSINITKWRLWAFDNVRNVHELKKRASREQLIWKDGNFFEKTEIRSAADKDKWAALQDKFNIPDVFIDDYTVPAETRVYYSKVMIVLGIAFGFACMGVSIYFFKQPDKTVYLGVVICIIGLVFAYQSVKS
jgi:hypothetical protein